jgi:hypothetical protein
MSLEQALDQDSIMAFFKKVQRDLEELIKDIMDSNPSKVTVLKCLVDMVTNIIDVNQYLLVAPSSK